MPGASIGQITQVMPLCLGASGSVRTSSSWYSAICAKLVQIFCPVTTRSSPSITARVCRPPRSEPAFGSEKPWHQTTSPRRIFGRWNAFCSSLPQAIKRRAAVVQADEQGRRLVRAGAGELLVPDQLLHQTTRRGRRTPSATRCRPSRRRTSCAARPGRTRGVPSRSFSAGGSAGLLATSHARAAARKRSSSGVKVMSIAVSYYRAGSRRQPLPRTRSAR